MADHYYYCYKRDGKMNMEMEIYHTYSKQVVILYMSD
jgi:hypothetical protein